MSDLVRFQHELKKYEEERDFLQQSNCVGRLGLQNLEAQAKVLNEGNAAVSTEIARLDKLTATQHETRLQTI